MWRWNLWNPGSKTNSIPFSLHTTEVGPQLLPIPILQRCTILRNSENIDQVLIQREGMLKADNSWEDVVAVNGGGDVMEYWRQMLNNTCKGVCWMTQQVLKKMSWRMTWQHLWQLVGKADETIPSSRSLLNGITWHQRGKRLAERRMQRKKKKKQRRKKKKLGLAWFSGDLSYDLLGGKWFPLYFTIFSLFSSYL